MKQNEIILAERISNVIKQKAEISDDKMSLISAAWSWVQNGLRPDTTYPAAVTVLGVETITVFRTLAR
ncbi:MAG: hypothetical protein JEZ11_09190 [Desulfobacterales bacterium]|nr:hypothetical protein [Desulfobacterales bacterium]